MRLRTILASLASVALLTACEDVFEDGSLQPDGSKPNLTIRNPTHNQALTTTGSVRVKFTAVDKDMVKELQVRVRYSEGNTDLVNFSTFPDTKIVEFDTVLAVPGIRAGDYTLSIHATDYRTNVASEEVSFSVK